MPPSLDGLVPIASETAVKLWELDAANNVNWPAGTAIIAATSDLAAMRSNGQIASDYPVSLFIKNGNTACNPANGRYILLVVNSVNGETCLHHISPPTGHTGQQLAIAWATPPKRGLRF